MRESPRSNILVALVVAVLVLLTACRATPPQQRVDVLRRVAASSVIVATDMGTGSGTVILNRPRASLALTAHHVLALSLDEAASGTGIHVTPYAAAFEAGARA